jgi:GAF domain-containing protein
MQCPQCQRDRRAGAKFCDECGTVLESVTSGSSRTPSFAEVAKVLREAHEPVIHVTDVTVPGPETASRSQQLGLELGYRAFLAVPMLRDGEPIGVINVVRVEPRAFTDRQICSNSHG